MLLMPAAILRSTAGLLSEFAVGFEVVVRIGGEVMCDRYEGACDAASRGRNCVG